MFRKRNFFAIFRLIDLIINLNSHVVFCKLCHTQPIILSWKVFFILCLII